MQTIELPESVESMEKLMQEVMILKYRETVGLHETLTLTL